MTTSAYTRVARKLTTSTGADVRKACKEAVSEHLAATAQAPSNPDQEAQHT